MAQNPSSPDRGAKQISDDFMKLWHEVLPRRFGIVEIFNQNFPVRHSPAGFRTTLEIGAGLGEHLHYEKLTPEQEHNYHALDLRENMAAEIRGAFRGCRRSSATARPAWTSPTAISTGSSRCTCWSTCPTCPPRSARSTAWSTRRPAASWSSSRPRAARPTPSPARSPPSGSTRSTTAATIPGSTGASTSTWPRRSLEELAPWFTIEARSYFPLQFRPSSGATCASASPCGRAPRPRAPTALARRDCAHLHPASP